MSWLSTLKPESCINKWPLGSRLKSLSTCNGGVVPKEFRSSVFKLFVGPPTVRLLTVIDVGKLTGVNGLMATALKPEFVMKTD